MSKAGSMVANVAKSLVIYREAKAKEKEAKANLIRLACELGLPQEEAIKMSVTDFLDGYLVANNVVQQHRKVASDGIS
jgi:hypothetical protein